MSFFVGRMAARTRAVERQRADTVHMTAHTIAGIAIPDSPLVRDVTEYIRDVENDLLFDHSRRVFLFGVLQGERRGLDPDLELLYVGAMFHDIGLTQVYRESTLRFEVDGADAARDFLLARGVDERAVRKVWLSIALHTTPGVPEFLDPEIALVTGGRRDRRLVSAAKTCPRKRSRRRRPLIRARISNAAYSRRSRTAMSIALTARSATSTPTSSLITIRRSSATISSRSSLTTNGRSELARHSVVARIDRCVCCSELRAIAANMRHIGHKVAPWRSVIPAK
jgi:hypothetical protein